MEDYDIHQIIVLLSGLGLQIAIWVASTYSIAKWLWKSFGSRG